MKSQVHSFLFQLDNELPHPREVLAARARRGTVVINGPDFESLLMANRLRIRARTPAGPLLAEAEIDLTGLAVAHHLMIHSPECQ